ncbi:MAG: MerR family transcriptional regulator [Gemmatimonadetes bacterium]|nr:MerR family transcriptional regulator [Gemmatimonadota bacterium]
MRVGEVARETGVSVRSIRYYEQAGLLHATRRTNGYREFDAAVVDRVRAIRSLVETGFTLEEVISLSSCLAAAPGCAGCCNQTVALYRDKLAKVNEQVRTLAQLAERIEQRIALLEPC